MAQVATALTNKPAWVDLSTTDAEAARDFYSKLFGWRLEISEDPQYGGYATAKLDDKSVAGIGPKQEGIRARPRGRSTSVPKTSTRWRRRSRTQAAAWSRRRSTSVTRAAWRSSPIRPARSSRPGRPPG